MPDISSDIKRLNDLASSWREAIATTEPEVATEIAEDPAVQEHLAVLTAALSAQRGLSDLLEIDALDRFHANKELESLATNSLKDAASVVRRAQSNLVKAVRTARAEREKAAIASTISRVSTLLRPAKTSDPES